MRFIRWRCRALLLAAVGLVSGCMIVTSDPDDTGRKNTGANSHTHTWGYWIITTTATCYAPGVETRTCTQNASHKETRVIAPLTGAACNSDSVGGNQHTHTWGFWVITAPATCDAPGVETRICAQNANHKETRVVAQLTGAACNSGDGVYESVVIGDQRWMSKNLNIQTEGSWCYGEDAQVVVGVDLDEENEDNLELRTLSSSEIQANCDKYGRLYTWRAAKTACPSGWHLPSSQDWGVLIDFAGGGNTAGKKLKARSGWDNNGSGTDDFGFSALPGGLRDSSGYFGLAGVVGRWWTATEDSDGHDDWAGAQLMDYGHDDVDLGYGDKMRGVSVRCIMDN